MRPLQKRQTLAEYADAAEKALLTAICLKYGRKAKWDVILRAICLEGQYVREASPSALLIYERYVGIALAFLTKSFNEDMVREMWTRVNDDMKKLAYSYDMLAPHAGVFSETERGLILETRKRICALMAPIYGKYR